MMIAVRIRIEIKTRREEKQDGSGSSAGEEEQCVASEWVNVEWIEATESYSSEAAQWNAWGTTD